MLGRLSSQSIRSFQNKIYSYFKKNRREFAWRKTTDPYKILVSEIMLQQTQTKRVVEKYQKFIKTFPNFKKLATASLKNVLKVWQGMGYNRRALYLHKIATKIIGEFKGKLPANETMLLQFKGIGKNTAASVCAFAFNQPTVFIETNIRTVFIHHFFKSKKEISDKDILPLVEQTLDKKNPRVWYYALMDYGVHLKKLHTNPSRRSSHYAKQSKFEGSNRQIRGAILKTILASQKSLSSSEIVKKLSTFDLIRVKKIIKELTGEKFLHYTKNKKIKIL